MTSKIPRTGNQYSIHYGDYSAVICELDTKIHRFDHQGREIFCPLGVNGLTPTHNGYVLAPWLNRIENDEYDSNGRRYCALVNEYHPTPCNNVNHGYVYHYVWKFKSLTDSATTLSLRLLNLGGHPFDAAVTVAYELGDNGMTATINTRNDDDEPVPWALGLYSWLTNGEQDATTAKRNAGPATYHLQIKTASHMMVNEVLIPTGTESVTDIYDLNDGPTLEGRAFNGAWIDMERAADGTTTTTFTRPDGIRVKIIDDETTNAWQCYTATGTPLTEHSYSITVESMTALANAFRADDHLATFAPNDGYTTVVHYEVIQKQFCYAGSPPEGSQFFILIYHRVLGFM